MKNEDRVQSSFEENRSSGPRLPVQDKTLEGNLAPPHFPVANLSSSWSKTLPQSLPRTLPRETERQVHKWKPAHQFKSMSSAILAQSYSKVQQLD